MVFSSVQCRLLDGAFLLSDPTKIRPPNATQVEQYPCRTVFSVVSQIIAATPPLHSVKMAYRGAKDMPWREGIAEKACL